MNLLIGHLLIDLPVFWAVNSHGPSGSLLCTCDSASEHPPCGFIPDNPEHSSYLWYPVFSLFQWIPGAGRESGSQDLYTWKSTLMVTAQGDLMFGGKMRSILLSLGPGWGPGFGVGKLCEASSSTELHPNPAAHTQPPLPNSVSERLSLVKTLQNSQILQNSIGLNQFRAKNRNSKNGRGCQSVKAAFSRLRFLLDNIDYIFVIVWSSWLKRRGKLQSETNTSELQSTMLSV